MQQTGTVSRTTGRHIYAYCNLQTQQVIYSLKPSLHNASVKRQLPDTGANTSFVKLRKDLWHPLWSLSIPDGPHADAQGRHAFKKLREWRKLHETSWEPPPTLARPYSEKEIEKLQEEYDNRGGKKKESVYDIIKRRKKYLRVNTVMDQRANSIADLAAVLLEQDQLGSKTAQEKEEEATAFVEAERSLMIKLAEQVEKGGLKKIQARIAELEAMKAQADRLGEADESKRQLSKQVRSLHARELKMTTARDAVAEAKELLAQDMGTRKERAERRLQSKVDLKNNLVTKEALADGSAHTELNAAAEEIARLEEVLADERAITALEEYEESFKQLEAMKNPNSEAAAKYIKELDRREQAASAASALAASELAASELAASESNQTSLEDRIAVLRRKMIAASEEFYNDPAAAAKYRATHIQKKEAASEGLEARSRLRRLKQRKGQIEVALENQPILLEADQGGIEHLTAAIHQLQTRQNNRIMHKATDHAKSESARELNALIQKRDHMIAVTEHYAAQVAAASEIPTLEADLAKLTDPETPVQDLKPGTEEYNTALKQLLPPFPKPADTNANLPKRGRVRAMQKQRKRPVFASRGIRIKWRNPLDAEYAQEWPQDVEHMPMGLTRHTAPHVEQEAVLDVVGVRQQKANAKRLKQDSRKTSKAEQKALEGVKDSVMLRLEEAVAARDARVEAQRAASRREKEERRAFANAKEERPRVEQALRREREGGESMSELLDAIR